jgi:hypothetical protein
MKGDNMKTMRTILIGTVALVGFGFTGNAGTNHWIWTYENPSSATTVSNIEKTVRLTAVGSPVGFTNVVAFGTKAVLGRWDYPSRTSLSNRFDQFSMLLWIKPTTANLNGNYLFQRLVNGSSGGNPGQIDSYFSSAQPSVRFFDAGNVQRIMWSGKSIPLNSWTHLAFTFDNGYYQWFTNGYRIATGTVAAAYIPSANPLNNGRIGNWGNNIIDDFGIFDRAVSANEINRARVYGIENMVPPRGTVIAIK